MQNAVIGVAGAGVMGGGIAQMFAEHGFRPAIWGVKQGTDFTSTDERNERIATWTSVTSAA